MRKSSRHWAAMIVLLLASGIMLTPGGSDSRRLNWHEILVAQTASQMLERSEFLVPHIGDRVRLKKPPLSYWLSIAAHRMLGDSGSSHVSEFEARLPSMISGLLIIVVTFGIGFQLTRDPRGGLIAAALMATNWSFYIYSGSARPEMLYSMFCALMTFGLVWALRCAEDGRSTFAAAVVAWGAFGLALMAKGPQFPLFIILGVLISLLTRRSRPPLLKTLHPWMALLAIAVPLAYYGYLVFRFDNVISLWGDEMMGANRGPLWIRPLRFFYPTILVVSLAPWIIAFGFMVVDVWKRRDPMALLLAICVLISIFLVSFSSQFRNHYVLPLLPVCTALMAWSLLNAFGTAGDETRHSRLFRFLVWVQFGLVGVLIASVIGLYLLFPSDPRESIVLYRVTPWLAVAGVLYVVAAIVLNRNPGIGFSALVGTLLVVSGTYPWIGVGESSFANSAYRFVNQVEADLPQGTVLYYDTGKHLPDFFAYYGTSDVERLSLEQWKNSGQPKSARYFITSPKNIRDSGLAGEIVLEERLDQKDKKRDEAWVIFRAAPRN
ncbi:MAG: phospholipid carrier-dependent glycosyltransferase [Gammaproteobacteria bacterium]|jgi:4-amino-4-deoxy-L-arabinose transferase-like glycosyltransferase